MWIYFLEIFETLTRSLEILIWKKKRRRIGVALVNSCKTQTQWVFQKPENHPTLVDTWLKYKGQMHAVVWMESLHNFTLWRNTKQSQGRSGLEYSLEEGSCLSYIAWTLNYIPTHTNAKHILQSCNQNEPADSEVQFWVTYFFCWRWICGTFKLGIGMTVQGGGKSLVHGARQKMLLRSLFVAKVTNFLFTVQGLQVGSSPDLPQSRI
jgi:hypothetical protein